MSTAQEHYEHAVGLVGLIHTSERVADDDPLTVATVAQTHALLALVTVLHDLAERMPMRHTTVHTGSVSNSHTGVTDAAARAAALAAALADEFRKGRS